MKIVATNMPGGLFASWMRTCSGEPCCMNTYTATGDNQKLTVGVTLPGDIMAFAVAKGFFLCFFLHFFSQHDFFVFVRNFVAL